MRQNPLLDNIFLHELDSNRNRITYARITSLTADQYPIERIEGVVTAGSITIDGNSAVRRVCNLTLTTGNLNINNIYWGLTTRVKIEIGIENNLLRYKDIYDEIIWFPQGIYVLTDFKTSAQVNNYIITLSGKDKMCLLNGDVGGVFNAETQLDTERVECVWDEEKEEYVEVATIVNDKDNTNNDGFQDEFNPNYRKKSSLLDIDTNEYVWQDIKRSIGYIIRELVHHYAQDSFHNIIVNVNELARSVLYNNETTFYLVKNIKTDEIVDIFYEDGASSGQSSYTYAQYPTIKVNFKGLLAGFVFQSTSDEDDIGLLAPGEAAEPWQIIDEDLNHYVVIKVENGEDLGYQLIPMYYPDDLIAGVGETVTSVLDKIVKTFGDYEYFYNLDGQFVFQKKQTYVNTAWNNKIYSDKDNSYIAPQMVSSQVKYSFESSALTTAYQNSPSLGNIKNDYTVWGKKRLSSGIEIPIHMRYAIDQKPEYYKTYDGRIHITENFFLKYIQKNFEYQQKGQCIRVKDSDVTLYIVDWREIIYQMAKDYYQHNHDDDFEVQVQLNNIVDLPYLNEIIQGTISYYEQGKTGYEQYYHDIEGFWRLLYAPQDYVDEYSEDSDDILSYTVNKDDFYETEVNDQTGIVTYGSYIGPWNKNITKEPSSLLFWFDFFEAESAGLGQFSVPAIGTRPKNSNNDSIRALIYKDIPDVIFIDEETYKKYDEAGWLDTDEELRSGYSYIIGNKFIEDCIKQGTLRMSTRSITAQETIDDLLYNYGYCNETITITSVPIYYLEPNTIISAEDDARRINGYYIINKITLPLDYKGTMSITAIKVPERVY